MAEKVDQMDPDEKIVEIAIERLRVFENHDCYVNIGGRILQPGTVSCFIISITIKTSPSFYQKMMEIFL